MKIRPQTRDIFYITDVAGARIGHERARKRKASGLKTRATLRSRPARESCTARGFQLLCAALAHRGPAIFLVIDPGAENLYAFGLEQAPLKGSKWLADDQFSASADDAMPGNPAAARCTGHRVADDARAAAYLERASNFSVRGYATARNSFYQPVDGVPGHGFSQSLCARHASKSAGNSCAHAPRTARNSRIAFPPLISLRSHDSCNH
jgi:hypothetical protein